MAVLTLLEWQGSQYVSQIMVIKTVLLLFFVMQPTVCSGPPPCPCLIGQACPGRPGRWAQWTRWRDRKRFYALMLIQLHTIFCWLCITVVRKLPNSRQNTQPKNTGSAIRTAKTKLLNFVDTILIYIIPAFVASQWTVFIRKLPNSRLNTLPKNTGSTNRCATLISVIWNCVSPRFMHQEGFAVPKKILRSVLSLWYLFVYLCLWIQRRSLTDHCWSLVMS